jgi:transcription factor E
MQTNLLKKVVENTAGLAAVKIVDLLEGKKDVNEFLIAKKLGLTINQTRNLLYRLSHLGILTSIRKKDKRKGWYIYFWTFNVLKSLEVLEATLNTEISRLQNHLEAKKRSRYYKCALCGREATEEEALLTNFTCSECGEVYSLADNAPIIEENAKQIEKLQKELNHIKSEIQIEVDKNKSKLDRLLRAEAKSKKELRAKNRAARLKEKNKLLNPKGKKKPVKKALKKSAKKKKI